MSETGDLMEWQKTTFIFMHLNMRIVLRLVWMQAKLAHKHLMNYEYDNRKQAINFTSLRVYAETIEM